MTEEIIAPTSQSSVFGQKMYSFKPITLNVHTPYDETENTVQSFVKDDFYTKANPKTLYDDDVVLNIDKEFIEFGEKIANENSEDIVSNFSSSELSSNNIVKLALDNGYSAKDAIGVKMANDAYKKISTLNYRPSETLNNNSHGNL